MFDLYSSVVFSEQPKETFKHMNMSDEDRISPYNIDIISSREVMRRKKTFKFRDYWFIQYQIFQTYMRDRSGSESIAKSLTFKWN